MRIAWVVLILGLATGARAERVAPKTPAKKPSCAEIERREAAVKRREDAVAIREARMVEKNAEIRAENERLERETDKLKTKLK
jgi:hypothetical protein